MPANLPPQYHDLERKFREVKSVPEKISTLEEMLAAIPKHKGTEKLQKEIKTKIAKLKKQTDKKSQTGKRGLNYIIPKEGAGQVILLGHPNTGKSLFISTVTNAHPETAPYPFTTRTPQSGMMPYKNIKIQLIDTPPITATYLESWMPPIIRYADAALLFADVSSEDPLNQIQDIIETLAKHKIQLNGTIPENTISDGNFLLKTLLVCTKDESETSAGNINVINELYKDIFNSVNISITEHKNIDLLKEEIYSILGILRVYSKMPGKKPDFKDPFAFKIGTTLLEVANFIHKDFAANFRFARIWGKGKFDGQKVNKDYLVQDEDIIEFHI